TTSQMAVKELHMGQVQRQNFLQVPFAMWFGEDQGRYVIATSSKFAEEVILRANLLALPARILGIVKGSAINIGTKEDQLSLDKIRSLHENWLQDYAEAA
ncbi:MAG: hypothetical protein ACKOW3_03520, partial [Hyphomicrobium sp.]